MNIRNALLFAALLAPLPACADPASPLTAADAWIREAPPGASVMAGYLRLHNGGDSPIRCDKVSGADFGAAEIHRTTIEDGRSRMLRAQVIEIPAHGQALLAPGGMHLMLFRPQRGLAAGDRSALTLTCGEDLFTVEFMVRTAP